MSGATERDPWISPRAGDEWIVGGVHKTVEWCRFHAFPHGVVALGIGFSDGSKYRVNDMQNCHATVVHRAGDGVVEG